MSDLILNTEGDLKMIQKSNYTNNINTTNNIFDLQTTNNYTRDLLFKALKTPKGKITLFILDNENIIFKDKEYGSEIYKELSEGITLNFLSRVKTHIIQTLINAKLNNNIKDVLLGVASSNTIELKITYTDSTITDTVSLRI